jgi:hypothetical protein
MMRRSRRVFEPEAAPLCATFEDAGVVGALARLRDALALGSTRALLARVPPWVWSLSFVDAVQGCARCDAVGALVDAMRAETRALTSGVPANVGPGSDPRGGLPTEGRGRADPQGGSSQSPSHAAALVRLCFGELLEAVAAQRALLASQPHEAPGAHADRQQLARLYADSCRAATWTSAHAEYLATLGQLTHDRPLTEALVDEVGVPAPELYSVPNASNLLNLAPLYERVLAPRSCAKAAQPLLAILTRATNAGSRGWESTLQAAAKESDGSVRVCMQAVAVCLAGLHPCVHPAARRDWRVRLRALHAARARNATSEFKDFVAAAPGAIKEAVRLHLAAVLGEDSALLAALQQTHQSAGHLDIPPRALPPTAMTAAMHAFAAAGAELAAAREGAVTLAALVTRHLSSEPRSRKKAKARARSGEPLEPLAYYASWLGGRSGALSAAVQPAIAVVSGLVGAAFRPSYTSFWVHAQAHGHRASRLDSAQHDAIHGECAPLKLCALLPLAAYERVQRLVMATSGASLLGVKQACALLGLPSGGGAASPPASAAGASAEEGLPSGGASRATQEAELAVLGLGAVDAATLLVFARFANLQAQVLTYDLGATTRRRQCDALCARLLAAPDAALGESTSEDAVRRLPEHCSHLFVCSECRRIVNACVDGAGKDVPFNELGLSASMLAIDGDVCAGHMRCAKRSSAALRTAVSLEAAAEQIEVEELAVLPDLAPLPADLRPATVVAASRSAHAASARDASSEVAKLRRDIKNSFEQGATAISCGDVPLVKIPVLGRAIRVFGDFYGICAFCGCLAKLGPTLRFRGEPCCLRCDFAMLAGRAAADEMEAALPKPPPPACRYCGKVQPLNSTGAKWRRVDAPADTGGRNATVPPPLRVVWYCPSHHRSWLVGAHKTMTTTDIFAHLMNKARPMFGANGAGASSSSSAGLGAGAEELALPPAPKPSASSKRKSALARQISRNKRRRGA